MAYIGGLHELGGEHLMLQVAAPGHIMMTVNVWETGQLDFRALVLQGFEIIVRLNNGYEPAGTIPRFGQYLPFAERCAYVVSVSKGCHIWQVGNEMNHHIERPDGEVITPENYAQCYTFVKALCEVQLGHEDDQFLIGPVAPYNAETAYEGNESGDWIVYLEDIISEVEQHGVSIGGFAFHCYSRSQNPSNVGVSLPMGAPFENRQSGFRAYIDFANAVPEHLRHLGFYITETNPGADTQPDEEGWENTDTGWCVATMQEIQRWNKGFPEQPCRSLIYYRWPKHDRWWMDGKTALYPDLVRAFAMKVSVADEEAPAMIEIGRDDFNGEYPARDDPYENEYECSELEVSAYWDVDWLYKPDEDGILVRPEWKEKKLDDPSSLEGSSQGVHVSDATMNTWIYRKFTTKPGAKLLAHIQTMGDSVDGAQHGMVIAIDPLGTATTPADIGVIRGGWYSQVGASIVPWENRKWVTLTVETTAQASQCVVFLMTANDYKKSVSAHWDTFRLFSDVDEPSPPPPPPPSDLAAELYAIAEVQDMLTARLRAAAAVAESSAPAVFEHIQAAQEQLDAALALQGGRLT